MLFKRNLDGRSCVARFNAHLVAMRYVQKHGVDFDETYAPVVHFDVVLLVLGRFLVMGWHVHHADISTASVICGYRRWDLRWIEWSERQVGKSLFGLKQSLPLWFEKLTRTLVDFGFRQLKSCCCMFRFKDNRFKVQPQIFCPWIYINQYDKLNFSYWFM